MFDTFQQQSVKFPQKINDKTWQTTANLIAIILHTHQRNGPYNMVGTIQAAIQEESWMNSEPKVWVSTLTWTPRDFLK